MIDIKLIRENPGLVKENIKKKFQEDKISLVDKVLKLDEEWRGLKYKEDGFRSERNKISQKINELKKDKKDAKSEIKQAKEIPKKIEKLQEKRRKLEDDIKEIMYKIPNIIHKSVPIGKDESKNKVVKKFGKLPKFSFKVKNHVELAEELGLVDFDIPAKVSGKGFYYLKNKLALLNQALIRFSIDFMKKKRYGYIETPLMLNENSIYASMDKQAIEESVYSIKDEDLNLIGTAEQSLLAMHSDQAIPEDKLPKKYFSYSMCFRKEIGSHGINEKGLWRTHQFNKVEQFIFCKPEDSEKFYNELLKNSEEIMQALELPYRVLEMCSGDLSDWKHRSADIEVYRPTIKQYGEVGSLSNCTDYQARKLGIRVFNKKGERKILYTLNNTVLATSRILVAILENFQQKNGSIKIPKVLWKYTGFKEIKNEKNN
ncbi:MAG: serine--tRNA ligase [Nanoarchaeota archaeon]|nr:serine--tRNA ligase [Nanoarchaeota archaeon]MBU1028178.1 serine--tRNA ligase [Nanoarchaeota archaeon]